MTPNDGQQKIQNVFFFEMAAPTAAQFAYPIECKLNAVKIGGQFLKLFAAWYVHDKVAPASEKIKEFFLIF